MSENCAELYVDGHRILPALLADIAAAEHFIHVSIFLFFRDPVGLEVAEALASKARAGLAVRVLLNMEKTAMGDPFSTGEKEMMKHDPNIDYDPTDTKPLCQLMTAAGVQVQDTNIDYDADVRVTEARLRSVARQIRGAIAIDDMHIDHRKIVIIDGRIAWCGGANIGAQYMFHVPFDAQKDAQQEGLERKLAQLPEPWWKWHDSLTRFEGPIVRKLDEHFRDRWVLDGGHEFRPIDDAPLSPPPPPRGVRVADAKVFTNEPDAKPNGVRELYLELIAQAERSIFIENPYLYHQAIVDALVEAKRARPELRVDLVMPAREWNDNAFAHDAQQYHYARYLEVGIGVHEYQAHFNHLKMAVFDERWSIHGSTNLNYRSLEDDKDFEMVVLVDSEELARTILTEVRDVDLTHSKRFGRSDVDGHSIAQLRVKHRDPRTMLLLSRKVL